jgi:hypothetical protein
MSFNEQVKRKYRIQEMMDQLTKTEHAKIIKLIPKLIGKSINTFNGYLKIGINDKTEIPHDIVVKLEILFGLPPNGLRNIPIIGSHYKDLI